MNLQILKDIAKELDSLEVGETTTTEANIAQLLINAGLLKIEEINESGVSWKEYSKVS